MVTEAYAYGVGLFVYIVFALLVILKVIGGARRKDSQQVGKWFLYGALLMVTGWLIIVLLP